MKDKNLKLTGEKIYLRYVTFQDFAEKQELYKTSLDFYQGLIDPPRTVADFTNYVNRNLDEANECFVICQTVDNKIVGAINFTQIFRKSFQNCYLGYSLGVNFIGKGFMTEAVKLGLKFIFEELKLHRIEANVQPHNLASINVLKRCGFTNEGFSRKYLKINNVWRDHERWAIIFEDWQTKVYKK